MTTIDDARPVPSPPRTRGRTGRRRRGARVIAMVMAGLSIVVGVLVGAAPAQAVVATYVSGRPGYVSVNAPQILVTEHFYPLAGTYYSTRVFTTNGSTMYRSPATSGAQTVRMQYFLQTYSNGAWRNVVWSGQYSGVFSGSTTALTTPRWSTEPPQSTGRAGYRFIYAVTWFDSAGRQIGYQDIGPSLAADTRCATTQRYCTPYTDGVVV